MMTIAIPVLVGMLLLTSACAAAVGWVLGWESARGAQIEDIWEEQP